MSDFVYYMYVVNIYKGMGLLKLIYNVELV